MGCIQSRKDINDVRPNMFYVFNIDNCGNCLWAGELEVTEVEIILHRKGHQPTKWPLICLRRYGFDTEIFSFEAGRRCTTGEGIFAFKCRRAEQLFKVLQQYMKNTSENVLETLGSETPRVPSLMRPAAPPSEYLEPAPAPTPVSRFPDNLRMGYVSSGPLSPEVHSPGSPSSANILEVMPLAPLPSSNTQVTNLYQFQDFSLQRENNNNKKVCVDSNTHLYCNDVNSDLAMLRQSLHNKQTLQQEEELLEEAAMAPLAKEEGAAPLSPTHSSTSEHYAVLVVEKDMEQRLYMNVDPNDSALKCVDSQTKLNGQRSNCVQTPPSVDSLSKVNDIFTFMDKTQVEEGRHNYANLSVTEVKFDPRVILKQRFQNSRGSSLDTPTLCDDKKIKYAILDLHISKSSDNPVECAQALPPSSPKDVAVGYTTIDFNKTGALKSVSQSMEVDTEGLRKTRHNSTAQPPDPNIT